MLCVQGQWRMRLSRGKAWTELKYFIIIMLYSDKENIWVLYNHYFLQTKRRQIALFVFINMYSTLPSSCARFVKSFWICFLFQNEFCFYLNWFENYFFKVSLNSVFFLNILKLFLFSVEFTNHSKDFHAFGTSWKFNESIAEKWLTTLHRNLWKLD